MEVRGQRGEEKEKEKLEWGCGGGCYGTTLRQSTIIKYKVKMGVSAECVRKLIFLDASECVCRSEKLLCLIVSRFFRQILSQMVK